jgi:hypothetical protein
MDFSRQNILNKTFLNVKSFNLCKRSFVKECTKILRLGSSFCLPIVREQTTDNYKYYRYRVKSAQCLPSIPLGGDGAAAVADPLPSRISVMLQ